MEALDLDPRQFPYWSCDTSSCPLGNNANQQYAAPDRLEALRRCMVKLSQLPKTRHFSRC